MTSGIRKFGQREEVPDDWFGGEEDRQPRTGQPRGDKPQGRQKSRWRGGKVGRFFGWITRPFLPSSRTRLVFVLVMMLALPIAFDMGNQFVAKNGDRYTIYLLGGAWAYLLGFMAFTLGAVAVGKLFNWERIAVLTTAVVSALLHWLYATPGVKIFDVGYGIYQSRDEKAIGATVFCLTTFVASAGLQRLFKNRESQFLLWANSVRINLIAVAISLAIVFGIVNFTAAQDFPLVHVFRNLNWIGLGVLFALVGVVVPVLVLNYSASVSWLLIWLPVCTGWSAAVVSIVFDYYALDSSLLLVMAAGFGGGILVATFGTYRNRHRVPDRKPWTWPWALFWNTPAIAAVVALLYINNQYDVSVIYNIQSGFQWDQARELNRLKEFATVSYRWGNLSLDFTDNKNQELVTGIADKNLRYKMIFLKGVNEKLNFEAVPIAAAQVSIEKSKVSVEQLASCFTGILFLDNITIVESASKAPLLGIASINLRNVPPGTLTEIIENHQDPKSILQIGVDSPGLSRSDWESLGKLDSTTQIHLNLHSARKVAAAPSDFGQIIQRLPKANPVWLGVFHSQSNPNDVELYQLMTDLAATHLNLHWSSSVEPDSTNNSEFELQFDVLFLTTGITTIEPEKLYDAIHELKPKDLSKYHLLYSTTETAHQNALYFPGAGKFFFNQQLASTLESISFDKSWRLLTTPSYFFFTVDERDKSLVFVAKELYLDYGQDLKVLERFPNLEILQISESQMAPWSTQTLVELQLQFKNQTKLKKIIIKGVLNSTLIEALGQNKLLEELVVSQEAADSFGLENIQSLLPNVKITVLKADDEAWIPQHFRDHQQRVFAELREKYQAKIKAIEVKEEKDKATTK